MANLRVIITNEISGRLRGRPAGVALLLIAGAALYETLSPVLVNGDPVSRGWWGFAYGASTGAAVGLCCAVAVVIALTGHDLDRGYLAERHRLGGSSAAIATGQLGAACVAGILAWCATSVLTAALSLGDLVASGISGRTVGMSPPHRLVTLTALTAPLSIVVSAAALWTLIVAAGSGRRAILCLAATSATFVLGAFTLGARQDQLLALHPFSGIWRAVSALPGGRQLPGALTGPVWPYVISSLLWAAVVVVAARRRWGRLIRE